ncbi:Uncharacterized protein ALO87_00038 [Pseudomonas syringae pv. apii]|uniref:YybH family protein n=1 Tax=Pseudomonas syringae group TaxID=136849 RepID=UPI0006E4D003|nr:MULTISPECIES: DUF4440 domain-containing protein [Pseudomonas syringae group]KPW34723.1 Uncharacterized protein ALO87_00038 [Pseudomonas syringae pv. apii]MCF8977999.1 DUF4440 domain-containing protein [Pseudomonas syringae]MDY0937983.1 DUF4440 domain-containing protein [Pseudomonas viridiflava]MDY1014512.1 DUF4440 domain-containing protein [Pseudomonas viridiflava]
MPAYKPEDCDRLIFEHMQNGDLDSAVALFEPDCVFVVSDDNVVVGHAAIREALRGWINAQKLEWIEGPTALLNASQDIAVLRGTWAATFKGDDGQLTVTKGRNVEVVRRQADGTWRFIIDDVNGAT